MLTYEEFLKAHPELEGESAQTKLDAYDLYVSDANTMMSSDDWVLG